MIIRSLTDKRIITNNIKKTVNKKNISLADYLELENNNEPLIKKKIMTF